MISTDSGGKARGCWGFRVSRLSGGSDGSGGSSYFHDAFAIGVGGTAPELLAYIFAGFGGAEDHGFAAFWAGWNAIRGIGRIGLILFSLAFGKAGGGKLLAVAAVRDEGFFEGGNLLVKEVIGLVDKADGGVGPHGGGGVFEPVGVERPTLLIGEICQIGRISLIGIPVSFRGAGAGLAHPLGFDDAFHPAQVLGD